MELRYKVATFMVLLVFITISPSLGHAASNLTTKGLAQEIEAGSAFSFYENFSEFQLKRGGHLEATSIYLFRNVSILSVVNGSLCMNISCTGFDGGIEAHFYIQCQENSSYIPCMYYVNLSSNLEHVFGYLNITLSNQSYMWNGGMYQVEKIDGRYQCGNSSSVEMILYVDKSTGISLGGLYAATSIHNGCTTTVSNNFTLSYTSIKMQKMSQLYTVNFVEVGLPGNESWNLTIDNTTYHITGSNFSIMLENGTYTYEDYSKGYYSTPSSGNFTVDGNAVMVNIRFYHFTYLVFHPTGLITGLWYVNISSRSMEAPYFMNISVSLLPGSYTYSVSSSDKSYEPLQREGTIILNSTGAVIDVSFREVVFAVFFNETGLPYGYQWAISFNGVTESSTSNSVIFYAMNGTYQFFVVATDGYNPVPISGLLTVNGKSATYNIDFQSEKVSTSDIFNLTTISIISGLIGAVILVGIVFFLTGKRR